MSIPSTPVVNPGPRRRRRLSVEVYFVLYLTAIMLLLLGTTPFTNEAYDAELEQAIAELVNTDFEIDVEKIALLVPFVPAGMESDSQTVDLRRDTMNVIRAHGSFSLVEFRIVGIKDTVSGQTLPVERASLVRNGDSSVMFTWDQGETNNAAFYRILVEAEAQPLIPESVSSTSLRDRIEQIINERRPMRDTAAFTVNVLPYTSSEYLLAVQNPPMLNTDPNDTSINPFDIFGRSSPNGYRAAYPVNDFIKVPPGSPWQQRLVIVGADPSQVSFSLPDGVRIISRGSDHVYIGGKATERSNQQIAVRVRWPDGESTSASFSLGTSNLDAPQNLAEAFYPGEEYRINFGSEGINNSRISVRVVENNKVILKESETGAAILYSPSVKRGTVKFTQFLDGKEVTTYSRDIVDFPDPAIRTINSNENEVTVETVTYGRLNGRPNVAVLRVMDGNGSTPEELGAPQRENSTGKITQTWIIRRKDRSQPLSFTAKVWDLVHGYGQASTFRYGK